MCGCRYQGALEVLARLGIGLIHAVVLTHEHMDACGGLDDLRDITNHLSEPLPIYCDARTLERCRGMYPYLTGDAAATGGGAVPKLTWRPFEPGTPFTVEGVELLPLLMEHGEGNSCCAFRFSNVLYASDVSRIPDPVRPALAGVDTAILDTLWWLPACHASHFGVEQALAEVSSGFGLGAAHRPRRTFLVGLMHEVEHGAANADLVARGAADVELAYDGLVLQRGAGGGARAAWAPAADPVGALRG